MTEIMQIDKDAAENQLDETGSCGCDICFKQAAEAFALHRETERNRIIEFMRDDAHALFDADPMGDLLSEAILEVAQAIAKGEHYN